jgi:hypothetical protein
VIGERGLARVRANYSTGVIAGKTLEVYRQALELGAGAMRP